MTNRPAPQALPDRTTGRFDAWKRWEVILLAVAAAIFIFNAFASPHFLSPHNLSDATFNFTEKAIIGFAMALLIVAGEIDLSVASIIALASTAMGAAAAAGFGPAVLVVIGLSVGIAAGAFNGLIVTRFQIPSIVVTIGTMSLFRGVAYVVLGDQAYRRYPAVSISLARDTSGGCSRSSSFFSLRSPAYSASHSISRPSAGASTPSAITQLPPGSRA